MIMADEPADAWAYALKAGVPDRPFFSSQWPEIDGGVDDLLFPAVRRQTWPVARAVGALAQEREGRVEAHGLA